MNTWSDTVGVSCESKRTLGDREELRRQMSLLRAATTTRIDEKVRSVVLWRESHQSTSGWLHKAKGRRRSIENFTFYAKVFLWYFQILLFPCSEESIDHWYISCPAVTAAFFVPTIAPPSVALDVIRCFCTNSFHFIQNQFKEPFLRERKKRIKFMIQNPIILQEPLSFWARLF